MWELQLPGILRACSGLQWGWFFLYIASYCNFSMNDIAYKSASTIQSSWWQTHDVRNMYKTPRIELKHWFEKCPCCWLTLHKCASRSFFTNSHSSSAEGKNTWRYSSKPPIRFHQLTVTKCKEQTSSWENNRFSASPEIPRAFYRTRTFIAENTSACLIPRCIIQQIKNFVVFHNEVFEFINLSAYCCKFCLIFKSV